MSKTSALEQRGGHAVGRDPRTMSHEDLRATGHNKMSAQKALRLRCLDCCAGQANEVRLCVSLACPAWPFRMGSNPWRPELTEEQKEAKRASGARLAATSRKPHNGAGQSETDKGAATPVADNTVAGKTPGVMQS